MRAARGIRAVAVGAGLLAAMSSAAGCAATEGGGGAGEATVYLSVPLSGPDAKAGRDVADAAELALDQADNTAGGVAISLEVLDSAPAEGESLAVRAGANARTATEDASAIAYIGELTSGGTRTSLPLTNGAGLLQVSPSASAMDLVREPGTLEDPNETYAVGGARTFVRVIPGDAAQAEATAEYVEGQDLPRVAILRDGSAYGDVLADAFSDRARELGLRTRTAGGSPLEARRAGDQEVELGDREATYLAAESADVETNSTVPGGPLIVPDALIGPEDQNLLEGSVLAAGSGDPLPPSAVSGAIPAGDLPPAGEAFAERFEDILGRRPGRYAAYGYESMALILDGVGRAASDAQVRREDVVGAAFQTRDRDSILGGYSIDENGETTLREVGFGIAPGARVRFVDPPPLPAGSSLGGMREQLEGG